MRLESLTKCGKEDHKRGGICVGRGGEGGRWGEEEGEERRGLLELVERGEMEGGERGGVK